MRVGLKLWIRAAVVALGLCLSFSSSARAGAPAPTLEQRVAGLEAYLTNGDPAATLKVKSADPEQQPTTASVGVAGPGHNAWMMISAALVLFMTLPGLALFYGGLVRSKNVLSIMAQCLGITGLVTILWWAAGYSLVFGKSFQSPFLGGLEFTFLRGVTSAPNTDYAYWVSQNVFSMYQLMFAIITPVVLIGAVAERMKFSAILFFTGAWMFVVYFPLAHMVWGSTGWMNGVWNPNAGIRSIDFAGGFVVEMASGWSALTACIILGKRIGWNKESMPPHSMVLCMVGTGLLWVGWYGFNAGSALAADGVAANAFLTTTLAASVASFVWAVAEYFDKGKASVLGFCSGAVAGLVTITPAAGFVDATGAVLLGVAGGFVPWFFCTRVKRWFGYDDTLDVFGVHAIGGTIGSFLTGIFATAEVNPNLHLHLKEIIGRALLIEQAKAIVVTLLISVVGTAAVAWAVKFVMGLRPSTEAEREGLDVSDHEEKGYIY
jgi:Amt family ammonium transporter